jgi:hypothetical protein
MRSRSGPTWQNLQALVLAIDAADRREPYPRLARLMESLVIQRPEMRWASVQRPSHASF